MSSKGGKLFLLDSGETKIHQIFFDGCENSLCIQEAVGGQIVDGQEVCGELDRGNKWDLLVSLSRILDKV